MRNICATYAQHYSAFCPSVSGCVQYAEAILFCIDAGQEPISRSESSVATRSTSLVQIQYRPQVTLPVSTAFAALDVPFGAWIG
jgi:hypothetical protein